MVNWRYRRCVATSVSLEVTATTEVDDNRSVVPPAEVLRAVAAAGQPTCHGMSRRGQQPWRFRFHLTGPGRVAAGKTLEAELRAMGYEADVSFSP